MTDQKGDPRHLETLDRDLERYSDLKQATSTVTLSLGGPGLAVVFVLLADVSAMLFFGQANNSLIVVIAACLGACCWCECVDHGRGHCDRGCL